MSVHVFWDLEHPADDIELTDEKIADAVSAALRHGERDGLGVQVILCEDAALNALHERFLGDSTPTDVITFDLGDDDDGPAGELYVSVDAARRVASEYSQTVENELLLYVVHGTLHLCGYDDHEDEKRRAMRRAEARVFDALGVALDVERHEQL